MEKQLPRKPATFETVWASLQELAEMQKETERQMKETDRRLDKMVSDTDRLIKERARETDRLIKENAREADRRMKDTDWRMNKMQGRFDNRWGDFMESLVEGDLVALLQRRDILVDRIHPRPYGKRNGEDFEFDIVAINGVEVVVVEVKTTLCAADIKHFVKKLLKYTYYEPEHRGKTIYGAMAYLKTSKAAKTHAERQGLFVIRATGDSASIVNEEGFVPRVFE